MTEESGLDGQFLLDEYARYRRWGVRLFLGGLLLLTLVIVLISLGSTPPYTVDYNKLGVHLMLDDGQNQWPVAVWDAHLAAAGRVSSPGGIAVQMIRVDDLDPARWQVFMDLAAQYDLTPVLRLATTLDLESHIWSVPEADNEGHYTAWGEQVAAFLNALQWPSDEKHVILLNEPNNGREWGGRPDAAAYAQLVVDVTGVLREQVAGVVILSGALDLYAPHTGSEPFPGTDVYYIDANTFMDEMAVAQPDIFTYFDIWNSHAYPMGAFIASPAEQVYRFDFLNDAVDTTTPPPDGIANRGVNGYEWELWKLAQWGIKDLPVMISEVGWRHTESVEPNALDSGENYPDAQTAARFLDVTLRGKESPFANNVTWQPLLADDRIIAVAPFVLDGVPRDWGHSNWLQLDSDGQIIGTYPVYDMVANYPFEESE